MISDEANRFASRFAALGHAARLEVLRLLLAAHPDGLVVGEIQERLEIPASTLSHHLDALRQEGLVTQEREGRNLRYRAGTDTLSAVLDFLYAECCSGAVAVEAPVRISVPSRLARKAPKRAETLKTEAPRREVAAAAAASPIPAGNDWRTW